MEAHDDVTLLRVTSQEQWEALTSSLTYPASATWWSDGLCVTGDCEWQSVNREFTYTAWESSVSTGVQDYVVMKRGGWIVTTNPSDEHYYVCQMNGNVAQEFEDPMIVHVPGDSSVALSFETPDQALGWLCCQYLHISSHSAVIPVDGSFVTIHSAALRRKPRVILSSDVPANAMFTVLVSVGTTMSYGTENNVVQGQFYNWLVADVSPSNLEGQEILPYFPPVPNGSFSVEVKVTLMSQPGRQITNEISRALDEDMDQVMDCYFGSNLRCHPINPTRWTSLGMSVVYETIVETQMDAYGAFNLIIDQDMPSGDVCTQVWPDTETAQGYAVCPVGLSATDAAVSSHKTQTHITLSILALLYVAIFCCTGL